MNIHLKSGATVCTPDNQYMEARCKRLKAELKRNKKSVIRVWGK